ncbi:MAG: DnaD domain protein [Clostridia bacterium]|nr:DnaD domain protein [Clostridia bacterium]
MRYRLGKCHPDSLLFLPREILDKIEEAGEGELRILLHLSALLSRSPAEEEEILTTLSENFSREEILSALAFWRGVGILKTDGKKGRSAAVFVPEATVSHKTEDAPVKKHIDADEAPFYTPNELAEAGETKPDFKNLVSFAEDRLEKVMNQSELARLYSFLDYLKMPLNVIMLVIEDCVSRDKKSLRYITKMLTSFQDDGIDSYEKAEKYFLSRKESARYEAFVRHLFGLGDRKLTKSESEILETWRLKFGYGEKMLDAAYEKTVASAKNPSIKYMHKILESWYNAGATTPEEAAKSQNSGGKAEKSYDLDDFFQQAVSRGRKDL